MMRQITRSLAALLAGVLLAAAAMAADAPVNINTASAEELATISGIGPAKAAAIIEHRDKNGQFKTVDDLKLVRGIGDKMLEQLRPQVTVGSSGGTNAKNAPAPNAATR
jgi:competence protein ComEA